MTMTAKQTIIKEIQAHGFGWAFCAKDFLPLLKRNDIDTALFYLEKEHKIRKLMRGIYDYPRFSLVLQKKTAPDIDQVASAIARNLHHEMQLTGNSALNYLKLSTQIPSSFIFLWDGRSQDFSIGDLKIHFKSASKRDFLPQMPESRILIQALRILGGNLSQETQNILKKSFTPGQWNRILQDTTTVPNRLYKQIYELANSWR